MSWSIVLFDCAMLPIGAIMMQEAGSDIRASRTQAWERTPPTPLECTAFSSVLEAKQGRFRIDALSSLRPGSVSDVR